MEGFEDVLKMMSVKWCLFGVCIKIFCFYFIRHPKGFGRLSLNVTLMNSDVFGMGKKIKLNKQPLAPLMIKQAYFQPEWGHQSISVCFTSQTECLVSLLQAEEELGGWSSTQGWGGSTQLFKPSRGPCLCCSGNKEGVLLLLLLSSLLGSLNFQNCQIILGA